MLQLEDGTHFPLSPAHSVTSVSAFQFQPAEQGKSTQVKRNDGSPSFPFHRERNYSCGEQVPDPSPGRNRRGLSSCEAQARCLGQVRLQLHAFFLQKWVPAKSPIQSTCFLCCRALRYQAQQQTDKCTQNDSGFLYLLFLPLPSVLVQTDPWQ